MNVATSKYLKVVTEVEEFYDKFAGYYDEFVPPKEMRAVRIQALVNFVRRKTGVMSRELYILELGCGTASYAIPLAKDGHHIIGVDISSKMRNLALQKITKGSRIVFDYLQADWLTALKKWKGRFDCILCIGNSIIHNPPETLPMIFNCVFDSLKPHGVFIINGRRIERELDMTEGFDMTQNEILRSAGPTHIPGIGLRNALRFMFMTKVTVVDSRKTVITFYTYDNYEHDGRRFVCHRLVLDNTKVIESKPELYDTFAIKTYFIFEDKLMEQLGECGFVDIKEESPGKEFFSLEKNWYITALKPSP